MRLARLRLQHLRHQVHDRAVGVELGGGVTGIVGELLDEVFVALAQFVLGQVGDGQLERAEVLDQVAQHRVGQAVLVGPLGIAKDAVELVGVGRLDGTHGGLEGAADILGGLAHLAPVGLGRNLEAVVLREVGELLVPTGFRQRGLRLLVEDVAEALVEQQREDELLVVARVDGAAQERGRAPQVGFELLLGDAGAHRSSPSRLSMAMSFSSAANAASALSFRRCIASSTVSTSCSTCGST